MRFDDASSGVIRAAIEVHRALGPGLLESAYEACLAQELTAMGLSFERQRALSLEYKGVKLPCAYRLDFLIESELIVAVKAVEKLLPVHEAQALTYLRLTV